jgi:hypothetical protein
MMLCVGKHLGTPYLGHGDLEAPDVPIHLAFQAKAGMLR